MKIDRELVLDELRKQGQSDKVQKALDELPAKVDHEQHAALLEKFGIKLTPTLVVLEQKVVRARLESPRGSKDIERFLAPCLK